MQKNLYRNLYHSIILLDWIKYTCHTKHDLTLPITLEQLKISYKMNETESNLQNSFRQLSKLTKLALYGKGSSWPNGKIWEKLIQSSLPLLGSFQFCFRFFCFNRMIDDINPAMASFSTPFYLTEKCWFIRCTYTYQYRYIGYFLLIAFCVSRTAHQCIFIRHEYFDFNCK
jgi:hypothetical protein